MEAQILKVVNNNVLIILDEKGDEAVAMGRGIGFKKKSGEVIPYDKIEKVFVLSEKELNNKLQQLISVLPAEHFMLSEKIIQCIKSVTNWSLSDNIYITLTDHISAAIYRHNQNIHLENALHWDIKHLYPEEYILGKKALDIIEAECGIQFPSDEASYIAMHLVNARLNTDGNMEFVHKVTKLIREITNIIRYHFHFEHALESGEYYQLINYIKTLAPQIFRQSTNKKSFLELFDVIQTHYAEIYPCVKKIQKHIETQYSYSLTGEEMLSISICISQLKNQFTDLSEHS